MLFACLYRDTRDNKLHLFKAIDPICSSREELEKRIEAFQEQTRQILRRKDTVYELFVVEIKSAWDWLREPP